MTVNYRESAVSGTQWNRCSAIHIQNPYGGTPSINVQEETILIVDDAPPLTRSMQHFGCAFDPAALIELRNPQTDELLGGSVTQGEVYAILYSLYRQMAG